VRQLNTTKVLGRIIWTRSKHTWVLSLHDVATSYAVDDGVDMWEVLLKCLLVG